MIRTSVKLAAFVALCGLFTGYLALTIGNIRLFDDTYTLRGSFDDVSGLLEDDNVKVAGVVVGKVTGIDVEKGRAVVTFEVRDDVRVPADSAAGIRWRNLLGQRYLYLYPGSASTVLEDGDEVAETRSVVDLGALFNRLGPIVAAIEPQQVNTFLDAVVEALDGNEQQVGQVIDDLATLVDGLATRDEAIGRLVEDLDTVAGTIADRDEQIRTVLDNLVTLAETFSANTDVVEGAIDELGPASRDAAVVLGDNRAEIDRLLASLLQVVRVVDGRVEDLDAALGDLPAASQAIFRTGRFGEWLNQVILCASHEPPPPGRPCASPIVKDEGGEASTAGGGARPLPRPAPPTGAEAITDLLGLAP